MALDKEALLGRPFVLTILLDEVSTVAGEPFDRIAGRLHIKLHSQESADIEAAAARLRDTIIGHMSEMLERTAGPTISQPTVAAPAVSALLWRRRGEISNAEWNQIFKSARKRIWLLGHSMLPVVSDDHAAGIITGRAREGVDIRLVLLDPDDAERRQISEIDRRLSTTRLRPKIQQTIERAWRLDHAARAQVAGMPRPGDSPYRPGISIGVTTATIHNSIVIVDDRLLVTIYSHQPEMGDEGITVDLSRYDGRQRGACDFFEREFLGHWARSRVVLPSQDSQPIRTDLRVLEHADITHSSFKWYAGQTEELPAPHLVVLFPTYSCAYGARSKHSEEHDQLPAGPKKASLLCPNCMYGHVLNPAVAREMPIELFQDAVSQCVNFGVSQVEISGGGEPLHHSDAAGLLTSLGSARQLRPGLRTGLISNLHGLPSLAPSLANQILDSVSYGSVVLARRAEFQPGLVSLYLNSLKQFIRLRDTGHSANGTRIGVKIFATKANCASTEPRLVRLVSELADTGVDHIKVRTLRSETSSPSETEARIVADYLARLENVFLKRKVLVGDRTLEVDLAERVVEPTYQCELSTLFTVIEPNGDMRMCWNDVIRNDGRSVGNLFTTPLKELWGGARHREVCRGMSSHEVCNSTNGCHCRVVGYQEIAERWLLDLRSEWPTPRGRTADGYL